MPLQSPSGAEPNKKWVGLTFKEVQEHPWVEHAEQLRLIRRFAVYQKEAYRCNDDCTENGFNSITGSSDKLSFIRADTPVHVARAFARECANWAAKLVRDGLWEARKGTATLGEVEAFEVAADVCKKAFRREPTRQVMVVCLYNPWTRRAKMIILPCFVFGCFSAVHGWNCYSHLLTHAGRRLAAVPVTG